MKRLKVVLLIMFALLVLILLVSVCFGLFGQKRPTQKSSETPSATESPVMKLTAPAQLKITTLAVDARATGKDVDLDKRGDIERQHEMVVAVKKAKDLANTMCHNPEGLEGWDDNKPGCSQFLDRCCLYSERSVQSIKSMLPELRDEYSEYAWLCIDLIEIDCGSMKNGARCEALYWPDSERVDVCIDGFWTGSVGEEHINKRHRYHQLREELKIESEPLSESENKDPE